MAMRVWIGYVTATRQIISRAVRYLLQERLYLQGTTVIAYR